MDKDTMVATMLLLGYSEILALDDDDITFFTHPTKRPLWWDGVVLHAGLKNLGPTRTALQELAEIEEVMK